MPCAYITNLSNSIWKDLGEPDDLTPSYIQSKLLSEPFLGRLNNLLSKCYRIVSNDIDPVLDPDEQAIYALLYQSEWYAAKINKIINATDIQWVEVVEGDSRIRRSSSTERARILKDLKSQVDTRLTQLVSLYRLNNSQPSSVDYSQP